MVRVFFAAAISPIRTWRLGQKASRVETLGIVGIPEWGSVVYIAGIKKGDSRLRKMIGKNICHVSE